MSVEHDPYIASAGHRTGLSTRELIQLDELLDRYLARRHLSYDGAGVPLSVEQLRAEIAAAAGVAR